jgi:site-specific recombinase XerD
MYEYERKIKRLEALDIEVTFDTLFENNNRKANCTLSDCFEREIKRLETLGKYNSATKIRTVFSLVSKFRNPNIRLEEIDMVYLNDFELFLRKHGNKDNSIATKFSVLKAIYNKALSEELFAPKSNPFVRFKVGRLWTATRKRAISKEELQRLVSLEIPPTASPYVAMARDIFLFTYYTAGINIGDIAHLEHRDIRNGRVYYTRRKTGKDISCRLMPVAAGIIEKYSCPFYDDGDYIFPILDKSVHTTDLQRYNRIHKVTAKINHGLGELAKLAGIETHLTTYVARHTYATVLKRSGVNIAIISESLGHSDLSTTQIYLDSFENSQIDDAMRNLL